MAPSWRFYEQLATDPIRNPIAGEFFSTEAVENVAEAVVREGIQNSLDARLRKDQRKREKAHVRIFVSGHEGALSSAKARKWFEGLWRHVLAKGNGLRDQPALDDVCPYIVFEDFGTSGLDGDPQAHLVVEGEVNHFLNFFRAEGHSDKGAEDRGSWGVGKTVFPRASRISTFFGLTVRHSDKRQLLLGRSILKYHSIDTQAYKSDGYFGYPRSGDGLMLPIEDRDVIEEFKKDFGIKRATESGLSIVVPWYDPDGEDTITWETVLIAVLKGFFYPILMGHLVVTIDSPSKQIHLNADNLLYEVAKLEKDLSISFSPLIDLAFWAQTRKEEEFVLLNKPKETGSPQWSSELIPSDVVAKIRDAVTTRQRIALRVPMTVQLKADGPKETFFDVFLEHSEDSLRPVFIRDELIISDVKSPRTSQMRALVIVGHPPLANMLRDAETPAHTQWNADTGNFKNKYKFGPGVIRFVRQSVAEIMRIVNQAEQKPDPSITIDFFSLPAEPDESDAIPARERKPKGKKDDKGPVDIPPIPPSPPPQLRIIDLEGGFAIRSGRTGLPPAKYIEVKVAYDIRRGNALRKYSSADFDFARPPIRVDQIRGATVLAAEANCLRFRPDNDDFNIEVRGFDLDRDLYIRAEVVVGEEDGDQAR